VPKRPDLRERQQRLAHDAAIETTISLLDRSAPGEISMAEVAEAAGMSLRTLYRYFPTRDELLAAAGWEVNRRLGMPARLDSPEDIAKSFWDSSGRLAEQPNLARNVVYTAAGRGAWGPQRAERIQSIEHALEELTSVLPERTAKQVAALIVQLCSTASWVAIADESGLSTTDARLAVKWGLETLLLALREKAARSEPPVSLLTPSHEP
jgi:AcrR family transcriptional regulator